MEENIMYSVYMLTFLSAAAHQKGATKLLAMWSEIMKLYSSLPKVESN